MTDSGGGPERPADSPPDLGWHPVGAVPKEPGWYAVNDNPNEQNFWTGERWSGSRRWATGSGWVETGEKGVVFNVTGAPSNVRLSANPYAKATASTTKSRTSGASLSIGVLLLLVCGIALMFGSIGSWVDIHGSIAFGSLHISLNGIDSGIATLIGVNGYVTFIAGILITILAGLSLSSNELVLTGLTLFATIVTLVFASYDMFRIVQKISSVPASVGANVSVGWGLICVLSAAAIATLIAIVRLLQR
jgi:hypothetical protein